ncbi:PAS domain S-box protein [bacterium]|nr:PAS domain S-box protein [bacterium]
MENTRILIVEDDPGIAAEIQGQLKNLDYQTVSIVDSSEKAIHAAELEKPDIILMNPRIEGTLKGIETAGIIRSRCRIPTIFLTAPADEEYLAETRLSHPFGCLTRPLRERDLRVTLDMALYVTKVDREREQAEERFKTFFRAISDAVFVHPFKKEGFAPFIEVNDIACRRYGYTRDEFLKLTPEDITRKEDVETHKSSGHLKLLHQLGNLIFETTHQKKSGESFPVEINANIVERNGQLLIIAVVRDISERRRAEERLRHSDQKYRDIANLLPQVVFETDENGQMTFANRFAFDLFQYTQSDFENGINALQLVVPEEQEKALLNIARVHAGETMGGIEYTLQKKDGTRFPVILHSTRIIRDGKLAGMRGIVIDITSRKLAERELQTSIKKYRQIFENALTPYYEATVDGILLDISPSVEKYIKYKREELIGIRILDLYANPDQRDIFMQKLAAEGEIYDQELDLLDRDGTIINTMFCAKLIPGENKIVGSMLDMTERKKAAQALHDSQHRLAMHIQLTPMGVIEFDNAFIIKAWNPAAEKIFGYSREEALGRDTFDIIVPDYETDRVKKVHQWENPEVSEHVNDNKTKDGRTITCRWFNTPMLDLDGRVVGLTAVCEDITDQIKAEQALEKRILALTQPVEDTSNILFEDLFNPADIQQLQDDFARATGVSSIITQPDGTPITAPSNFSRLCNDIIRRTESGRINCFEANALLAKQDTDGPVNGLCPNCGLMCTGTKISMAGKHIASWLIGQVRDETRNAEQIRAYARELGVDQDEAEVAFYEVPAMSQVQFAKVTRALFTLASQIATIAFQNMQQARFITDRKVAEAALKDSEEKYRNVVQNAVEAICVIQAGMFKYVNPQAIKLYGYTAEELEQLPVADTIHPEDKDLVAMRRQQRERGEYAPRIYSHRIVTRDGRIRWVDNKAVTFTWENRPALLLFLTDITERKRSRELMIQTEKMMSVGGLAAGMAHELNNPLGGILQGAQNVLRRLSPDLKANLEPAKKAGIDLQQLQLYLAERGIVSSLHGIQESGKKASQIISNMMQFARKSETRMALTDLSTLVENVLELAGKDYNFKHQVDFRNIAIQKEFSPDLPLIPCSETEIEQVLLNLLNNATWAMVRADNSRLPQITLRIALENDMARIEVEDTGPGMNEETRRQVFQPFFTTKPVGEGTGLGLSVSYMIITNNHKGTIEVESELGKGTRFIIRLPLVADR